MERTYRFSTKCEHNTLTNERQPDENGNSTFNIITNHVCMLQLLLARGAILDKERAAFRQCKKDKGICKNTLSGRIPESPFNS